MPRKPKTRREPTPKQEGAQIVEAAAKAGADYAHEQVGSPHFHDWVLDQIAEGEEMRRADPNSVIPLETPADARKVARNMLQQLEWDTERQMDTREILEMAGATGVFGAGSRDWVKDTYGITSKDVTDSFFEAFRDVLESASTRDWLTDEVLVRIEEVRGVPAGGAARESVVARSSEREPSFKRVGARVKYNYTDGPVPPGTSGTIIGFLPRSYQAQIRWDDESVSNHTPDEYDVVHASPASKARRQPAAREARPQAGMTPEQRGVVVAALRHYGADLTDDDRIKKGDKVLGVRVEVRKGRLRMVQVANGSTLASYPAANVGTGVADFVESFWYWKPVAGVSEARRRRHPPAFDDYNRSAHAYDIEVVYPDESFARKHESQIGHIIGQPLVSQGALRDGYRMEYGPIDRDDYRRLEGLIYTKLGNAVRVRLVQVMYGAGRTTERRARGAIARRR